MLYPVTIIDKIWERSKVINVSYLKSIIKK